MRGQKALALAGERSQPSKGGGATASRGEVVHAWATDDLEERIDVPPVKQAVGDAADAAAAGEGDGTFTRGGSGSTVPPTGGTGDTPTAGTGSDETGSPASDGRADGDSPGQ